MPSLSHTASGRTEREFWDAVQQRDARFDGRFVYGVRSTHIYCRASCPSRRPRRESVTFFADAEAAERSGYRACKRCRPKDARPDVPGADGVRRAVAYIAAHVDEPITLHRLAATTGTSRFHLQRTFTRLVGVSPRRYQEALRAERFRGSLRRGAGIADATYDAGYGSSSRVYEGRPTGRGLTPFEYRRGGQGVAIRYAMAASPLGRVLVAATSKGVCAVKLGDQDARLLDELRGEYPLAVLQHDPKTLAPWTRRIVDAVREGIGVGDIPLDVRGTAFQWKVWRYLQSIPCGETRTYGEAAAALGHPTASRAVARACATNPVGVVIPCHRVVPKAGGEGGYRWGVERKRQLLRKERQ